MDAAYAVLIEEYTRVGISMLDAVEQTSNLRAGGASVQPATPGAPPVQSEEALAKQNEKAMKELSQMMGGLGT